MSLFIVVGVFLWGHPANVEAATTPKAVPPVTVAPTPIPTPIVYMLPYPGILPTHPLYFLKSLRDKVIEMLISDPLNKSEFYVLQADKKLGMGITFVSMGKASDAKKAFAEAFSVREQARQLVEAEVKAGHEVPRHIIEKLVLSLMKHEEVLRNAHEDSQAVHASLEEAQKLLGNK